MTSPAAPTPATSSVLGLIVPGQPVQVNGQVMSDTEILFHIPQKDVQHVVVFLTGVTALPDTMGASAYLMLPDNGFKYLGHISNEKPSAIFKIGSTAAPTPAPTPAPSAVSGVHETAIVLVDNSTRIGIVVEPLPAIQQKIVPKEAELSQKVNDYSVFVKALAESCYNHMSGWILTEQQWRERGAALVQEKLVPIGALEQWFDSFTRKLQSNPNFWKT
ncbi:unnamed protein product [Amoebophrya sp. A25]|nr:unnamed protein product [Amoebophrya sp. A25]|eukprot:GSA25T00000483001.1